MLLLKSGFGNPKGGWLRTIKSTIERYLRTYLHDFPSGKWPPRTRTRTPVRITAATNPPRCRRAIRLIFGRLWTKIAAISSPERFRLVKTKARTPEPNRASRSCSRYRILSSFVKRTHRFAPITGSGVRILCVRREMVVVNLNEPTGPSKSVSDLVLAERPVDKEDKLRRL